MKLERVVTGLLVALAVFWIGASFFVRGDAVPDWWLPVALGAGLGSSQAIVPPTRSRAPAWATAALLTVLAIAFSATAYGAIATPSRHWDGAASFDAKVLWLVQRPSLQQPFFGGEGVFHHSPDYQLLQALLVATAERLVPGGGRLVMPLLYLLLCGVVVCALRRRDLPPLVRTATALAVAVTPALLSPGGGAVDSGYHDLLMLLATTTIAAGLLTPSTPWFALGIGIAVVGKPEGAFYAAAALAVAFGSGHRALLRAGLVAFAVAFGTWLPVRAMLLHQQPSTSTWPLPAIAALVVWLLFAATGRLRHPGRARWLLVLAMPAIGLVTLPWLAPLVSADSAIGVYLRRADEALAGLGNLPACAVAFFDHAVGKLKFGLAFVMPIAVAVVARMQRNRLGDRELLTFLLLGLATTTLPFVLSPEPDLDHHLRSSLPRLLLHWVGAAWLLAAGWSCCVDRRPT